MSTVHAVVQTLPLNKVRQRPDEQSAAVWHAPPEGGAHSGGGPEVAGAVTKHRGSGANAAGTGTTRVPLEPPVEVVAPPVVEALVPTPEVDPPVVVALTPEVVAVELVVPAVVVVVEVVVAPLVSVALVVGLDDEAPLDAPEVTPTEVPLADDGEPLELPVVACPVAPEPPLAPVDAP